MIQNTKYSRGRKGFTLVELLAVIVILAIILVIAVPKVMNVIEDAKKATLESTAKMIAGQAEKQKIQNKILGKTDVIACDSLVKINDVDYTSCEVEFNGDEASVTIEGSGKFEGLYVCNGTKAIAIATEESCTSSAELGVTTIMNLLSQESTLNNGLQEIIIDPSTSTATYMQNLTGTINAGIRYVGANPNNKVYYNCEDVYNGVSYGKSGYDYANACELWRIIGVFDTKSTYSETENPVPRIKIVRDAVLSQTMVWDTREGVVSSINQWGETTLKSDNTTPYLGASLKQYLNGDYYNSLSSIAKGQIDDALWYTGAVKSDYASVVYVNERGDNTYTDTTINYTTKWVGKIGLIYPSDFGYAGTDCGSFQIYEYDNAISCGKTRNWLTPSSGYYWTISPYNNNSSDVSFIHSDGASSTAGYDVGDYGQVRPAVYLSANVQIIGGDGGTEPFKLK